MIRFAIPALAAATFASAAQAAEVQIQAQALSHKLILGL